MKDFYRISEGEDKRQTVLDTIKPICDVFGITDYDYIITKEKERLIVEDVEIGCRDNSIGATVMELINYIWIETVADNRITPFHKQTLNSLKRYWHRREV